METSSVLTIKRLQELTDVDFERDLVVPEQVQLRSLLNQFMENEARSCSMDFGCITPLYIYRMLGDNIRWRTSRKRC